MMNCSPTVRLNSSRASPWKKIWLMALGLRRTNSRPSCQLRVAWQREIWESQGAAQSLCVALRPSVTGPPGGSVCLQRSCGPGPKAVRSAMAGPLAAPQGPEQVGPQPREQAPQDHGRHQAPGQQVAPQVARRGQGLGPLLLDDHPPGDVVLGL